MEFVALDVETANADMASICQIGIAKYTNGKLVDEWSLLIDPEDDFSYINTDIHGISEKDVIGAPKFGDVYSEISRFLKHSICISHTHFDRVSITKAVEKYSLPPIETTWLDSARIARRTWEQCAWKGYGLSKVCEIIGHKFNHHDALEDAKASAHVTLAAIEKTGLDLDQWLKRVRQPIDPSNSSVGGAITRDGNPDGALFGEHIVFTGALVIPRKQAADTASKLGCSVERSVTKKTTLLVVGDQDITKLAGKNKSSKHIKAEQLIAKGQKLRIIMESDFMALAFHADEA